DALAEAFDIRARRGFHIPPSDAGIHRFRGPRLRSGAGCSREDNHAEHNASNQEWVHSSVPCHWAAPVNNSRRDVDYSPRGRGNSKRMWISKPYLQFAVFLNFWEKSARALRQDAGGHMMLMASSPIFCPVAIQGGRNHEKTTSPRDASRSFSRSHAGCAGR